MNLIPTSIRFIAAAVLLSGSAVLIPTGVSTPSAVARAEPAGPAPELQTIELSTTARAAGIGAAPAVPPRATRSFSLVGATWTDPDATLAGTAQVRTRAAGSGRWTAWQALESDGPDAADPDTEPGPVRGSTDPLWVGESDGVEARVVTPDGRATPLPAGLRLDLINPDRPAGAAAREPVAAREPAFAPGVVAPPPPMPRMINRAGWGADEAIVKLPPEYTTGVQVMFVHHTATSNGYSCGQSASIVRGIEIYHVRSRGWNDIGYNFLVDKCGTLFEGRRGGADRPVLGAHTLGFNTHSSAIAVIGDYRNTGVPVRVRTLIAQVAAYKVGAYGNDPRGRVTLASNGSDRFPRGTLVALNRISGHRDTGRTECPGNALYAQLGAIRVTAGAGPAGLRYLRITGAVRVGSKFVTHGVIRPYWTLTTPSAWMGRFDVLVDGARVASLPSTSRSIPLRLTAGTHVVAIRAVHLSSRSSTITARVVADPI